MGLFKEEMVGCQCDGCGDNYLSYEGYSMFVDEQILFENVGEDGWQKINGKWYCPECVNNLFDYDEETEVYTLKEKN